MSGLGPCYDSCSGMALSADSLPNDLASAHAMIVATREALLAAEARASAAESEAKHRALLIEKLKYTCQAAARQVWAILGAGRDPGSARGVTDAAETAVQRAAAGAKIDQRTGRGLSRSWWRASRATFGELCQADAGGCLPCSTSFMRPRTNLGR
jgi:hypothetical protein